MVRAAHFHPNGIRNQVSYSNRVGGASGQWGARKSHPFAREQVGRVPKSRKASRSPMKTHPAFRPQRSVVPAVAVADDATVLERGAAGIWVPRKIMAPMLVILALLAGGCFFDQSGTAYLCEEFGTCDAGTDSGMPDTGIPDAGIDAGIDAEIDAGPDAFVPIGDPPDFDRPVADLQAPNTMFNNMIDIKLGVPPTPNGEQITGYELDHWVGGAFVATIPMSEVRTVLDATQPYRTHTFVARAIYGDGTTYSMDSDPITLNTNGALIMRLDLNEGQGTAILDSSPTSMSATLVNSAGWTQDAWGTGPIFDGVSMAGSYIELGDASRPELNFDGTSPYTIEVHLNRTGLGTSQMIFSRIDNGLSESPGTACSFDTGNEIRCLVVRDWNTGDFVQTISADPFDLTGVPYIMLLSFNPSSGFHYTIDGEEIVNVTTTGSLSGPVSSGVASRIGASYHPVNSTSQELSANVYYGAIYEGIPSVPQADQNRCAIIWRSGGVPPSPDCD